MWFQKVSANIINFCLALSRTTSSVQKRDEGSARKRTTSPKPMSGKRQRTSVANSMHIEGESTQPGLSPSEVHKRELTRNRMRRWRQRQSIATKTRATTEFEQDQAQIRREKDRIRKQLKRASDPLLRQKEKQYAQSRRRSIKDARKESTGSVFTKGGKERALQRAKRSLPGDVDKWSEIVADLVMGASPTKKKKLQDRGILTPTKSRKAAECIQICNKIAEECDELKMKRSKECLERRHSLAQILCEDEGNPLEMVRLNSLLILDTLLEIQFN
jgi:hypothetical protein